MNMVHKKYICTYFDYSFLPRGLALFFSLKQFYDEFDFYILTFDEQTFNHIEGLNEDKIKLISFKEYNDYFQTSIDRFEDKKQYYFSATPNICIYLLEQNPEIDLLLYLDADVYIFNSLENLFAEVESASIAFCAHRFTTLYKYLSKNHGKYNVGVNFFRNDEISKSCLKDWQNDCTNWYKGMPGYDLVYFSDQIFLDEWERKYPNVKIIQNIGVNVAPWNIARYHFSEKNREYYVNESPLIIFHFSALKQIDEKRWNGNTIYYFGSIKDVLRDIYISYIKEVESYSCGSTKVAAINLKFNWFKKMFYRVMGLFLNEIVILK